MPIRMLRLDGMELVDRGAVVTEITGIMMKDPSLEATVAHGARDTADGRERAKESLRLHAQKIGSYVVLSHTWLIDDLEVVYEDTRVAEWQKTVALQGSQSIGFKKLEGFCNTARGEPYRARYGWMDTICIDKSSTSELDESIRSMYRWYLNSATCIVYLAETTGSSTLDGMERDRWFTRGWTLQEYLAPEVIKFHDQQWDPLTKYLSMEHVAESHNDKFPHAGLLSDRAQNHTLIQMKVEQATGIPPFTGSPSEHQYLLPTSTLSNGRIIKQMQWAARRETTRQEDRAYSLMGIFNVSFSIAYGEGGERAFFRLVDAILATKPADQVCELLAWGGRPVSDEIHTSRLLPSAPECYGAPAAAAPAWISACTSRLPPEPTVLTHIGLRVRLLLARAALVPAGEARPFDGHQVHFTVRSSVLKFAPLDVHLLAQHEAYPRPRAIYPPEACRTPPVSSAAHTPQEPQFLLAMYTFAEDNVTVRIPSAGLGFLLAWYPPPSNPWLKEGDMASAYLNAHSKVDTMFPVIFSRTVNSADGYSTVSKDARALQSEYLVLVSLYL